MAECINLNSCFLLYIIMNWLLFLLFKASADQIVVELTIAYQLGATALVLIQLLSVVVVVSQVAWAAACMWYQVFHVLCLLLTQRYIVLVGSVSFCYCYRLEAILCFNRPGAIALAQIVRSSQHTTFCWNFIRILNYLALIKNKDSWVQIIFWLINIVERYNIMLGQYKGCYWSW